MANIVGKTVVGGAFAAILAALMPSSAVAVYPQFGGPPVYVDPYNAMLGGATPSSTETVVVDATFSGPSVYVDPYNVILGGATVPSSAQTVAVDDLYSSYAFAPGYRAPRLWEGPISFDK